MDTALKQELLSLSKKPENIKIGLWTPEEKAILKEGRRLGLKAEVLCKFLNKKTGSTRSVNSIRKQFS